MNQKKFFSRWEIRVALALVISSLTLFIIHFLIFQDLHHIFIFSIHDIAFVPIEVLFVTLLIERMIAYREKRELKSKMRMLIGATFSEVGTSLMGLLSSAFPKETISLLSSENLEKLMTASKKIYNEKILELSKTKFEASSSPALLEELERFLSSKREFLIRLLENPALLEEEGFANALWAIFHLSDELSARRNFYELPESDISHLNGDIERVLSHLIVEWVEYLKHLKSRYPYLYSLALRANPLDPEAPIIVQEAII